MEMSERGGQDGIGFQKRLNSFFLAVKHALGGDFSISVLHMCEILCLYILNK